MEDVVVVADFLGVELDGDRKRLARRDRRANGGKIGRVELRANDGGFAGGVGQIPRLRAVATIVIILEPGRVAEPEKLERHGPDIGNDDG